MVGNDDDNEVTPIVAGMAAKGKFPQKGTTQKISEKDLFIDEDEDDDTDPIVDPSGYDTVVDPSGHDTVRSSSAELTTPKGDMEVGNTAISLVEDTDVSVPSTPSEPNAGPSDDLGFDRNSLLDICESYQKIPRKENDETNRIKPLSVSSEDNTNKIEAQTNKVEAETVRHRLSGKKLGSKSAPSLEQDTSVYTAKHGSAAPKENGPVESKAKPWKADAKDPPWRVSDPVAKPASKHAPYKALPRLSGLKTDSSGENIRDDDTTALKAFPNSKGKKKTILGTPKLDQKPDSQVSWKPGTKLSAKDSDTVDIKGPGVYSTQPTEPEKVFSSASTNPRETQPIKSGKAKASIAELAKGQSPLTTQPGRATLIGHSGAESMGRPAISAPNPKNFGVKIGKPSPPAFSPSKPPPSPSQKRISVEDKVAQRSSPDPLPNIMPSPKIEPVAQSEAESIKRNPSSPLPTISSSSELAHSMPVVDNAVNDRVSLSINDNNTHAKSAPPPVSDYPDENISLYRESRSPTDEVSPLNLPDSKKTKKTNWIIYLVAAILIGLVVGVTVGQVVKYLKKKNQSNVAAIKRIDTAKTNRVKSQDDKDSSKSLASSSLQKKTNPTAVGANRISAKTIADSNVAPKKEEDLSQSDSDKNESSEDVSKTQSQNENKEPQNTAKEEEKISIAKWQPTDYESKDMVALNAAERKNLRAIESILIQGSYESAIRALKALPHAVAVIPRVQLWWARSESALNHSEHARKRLEKLFKRKKRIKPKILEAELRLEYSRVLLKRKYRTAAKKQARKAKRLVRSVDQLRKAILAQLKAIEESR